MDVARIVSVRFRVEALPAEEEHLLTGMIALPFVHQVVWHKAPNPRPGRPHRRGEPSALAADRPRYLLRAAVLLGGGSTDADVEQVASRVRALPSVHSVTVGRPDDPPPQPQSHMATALSSGRSRPANAEAG